MSRPMRALLMVAGLSTAAAALTLPPMAEPPRTPGRGAAVKPPEPEELPGLIAKLSASDPLAREEATRALMAAGAAARALLTKALESPDPEVRWRARYVLAAIEEVLDQPAREPARDLFAEAIRLRATDKTKAAGMFREVIERFPGTRWAGAARERLAEMSEAGTPRAPRQQEGADAASLVRKLASSRWSERQAATIRLAETGEAARPALEKAARSLDPEVAWRARALLRLLADRSAAAAPSPGRPRSPNVLIELFGNDGRRPPVGTSEIDALVGRLAEKDPWQVARARVAILAIGEGALDALLRKLESADEVAAVEIMDLLRRLTRRQLGFKKGRWLTWWRRTQEGGGE